MHIYIFRGEIINAMSKTALAEKNKSRFPTLKKGILKGLLVNYIIFCIVSFYIYNHKIPTTTETANKFG